MLGGCWRKVESESSILASESEWGSSRLRAFDMPRNTTYSSASFSTLSRPLKRSHRLAVWRETVKDYSGRAFTRHSDRFPALSGLASEIEQDLEW
jgi:hypothetical protein